MSVYHQKREALNLTIGTHIREARQHRQWSQETLSEISGLQTGHIGRLERGETTPRADTLQCLALALDTKVGVLFGEPLPFAAKVLTEFMHNLEREG